MFPDHLIRALIVVVALLWLLGIGSQLASGRKPPL